MSYLNSLHIPKEENNFKSFIFLIMFIFPSTYYDWTIFQNFMNSEADFKEHQNYDGILNLTFIKKYESTCLAGYTQNCT